MNKYKTRLELIKLMVHTQDAPLQLHEELITAFDRWDLKKDILGALSAEIEYRWYQLR